jgi:hypothetical protein
VSDTLALSNACPRRNTPAFPAQSGEAE